MADDIKARKLAAARKKLKEYQAKEKVVGGNKSDHEQHEKLDAQEVRRLESTEAIAPVNMKTSAPPSTDISVASLSKSNASSFDSETASINGTHTQHPQPIENFLPASNDLAHSNTIELLINEKASLCSELAHYKAISKEKSLELEEANIRIQDALKRIEKLEKDLLSGQTQNAQLQANIERLNASAVHSENEVDKLRQENVELRDHVEELKQTLQKGNEQTKVLEDRLKEKECELELNRIRINQISDVASVENDSKVEALTQTKFMHEQQIRDLQAMVQQLETEREQSNQQYQNYVQHLNKEITAFSERNSKLTEENTRLAERERGLVEHVGELEKQLQQIIANQSKQSAVVEQHDSDKKTISEEEVELRTKELLNEKNVLSEKVKVQDAQIADMQRLMDEKLELIQQLEERIENFTSIQSDSTKLLAKVESNSVAASRAVAQNEELKKQLDEVQTKLIQVTNDKVELTNLLDAERYGNREIRANYETMENQLTTITEKLHFKDEEMIRLTKENTELSETIDKLKGISRERVDHDHHNTHNGKHEHGDSCDHSHDHIDGGYDGHDHDHHHGHDHHHDHDHDHDHHHDHDHGSDHHHDHDHSHNHGAEDDHHHSHEHHNHDSCQATKLDRPADQQSSPAIPQSEAMQKLEARFKSLMNDVANLTDEKQRLEHLVLQLQGETDTIGEYIALYQAQRRVLKQREIEKNTQLHKLKSEREELHNKVTLLNQLVNSLSQQVGAQMLNNNISVLDQQQPNERQQLQGSGQDHENVRSTTPSSASEASEGNQIILPNTKQLNSSEIIHAIKNIVADIKNSETNDFDLSVVPTLDHCSCCSGKFETI